MAPNLVMCADWLRLKRQAPVMAGDLPAGRRRPLQCAQGYGATMASGQRAYVRERCGFDAAFNDNTTDLDAG